MKIQLKILAIIAMIGIPHFGYTQTLYNIQNTNDVDIKLSGTSTLHDWEMDATKAKGAGQFIFAANSESELISLNSLTLSLKVKDLQSDSKGLDKNAYKALKTDTHKEINYHLTSSTLSNEGVGYLLKTIGKLTIAGVTKDINMDMHVVVNENKTITCTGSISLRMTDYNVEPPSFMMGLMTTGDETTLGFEVVYIK